MQTEIFGEVFNVITTDYAVAIMLSSSGKKPDGSIGPVEAGTIRLPLAVAKQLSMILRRRIKEVEERNNATIVLPGQSYEGMGVSPEDW